MDMEEITQKDWENFKTSGMGEILFKYLEKNLKAYKEQITNIVTSSALGDYEVNRLKWLNAAHCVVNGICSVTIEEIKEFLEAKDEL